MVIHRHSIVGNENNGCASAHGGDFPVFVYGDHAAVRLTIQSHNCIVEIGLQNVIISAHFPCSIAAPPLTHGRELVGRIGIQLQISLSIVIHQNIAHIGSAIGLSIPVQSAGFSCASVTSMATVSLSTGVVPIYVT